MTCTYGVDARLITHLADLETTTIVSYALLCDSSLYEFLSYSVLLLVILQSL